MTKYSISLEGEQDAALAAQAAAVGLSNTAFLQGAVVALALDWLTHTQAVADEALIAGVRVAMLDPVKRAALKTTAGVR